MELRRRSFRRAAAGLTAGAVAVGIAAAPVAAGGGDNWAYAVVRSGTNPPATLAPTDRGVTQEWGSVVVTRTGLGRYNMRITGFFGLSGVPLVTPLSGKPRTCTPDGWPLETPGQYTNVTVSCRDRFGDYADSGFTVSFREIETVPGSRATAYLYSDDASPGATYVPYEPMNYTSSGGDKSTVTPGSLGIYDVTLPSMGHLGGIVLAVAVESDAICDPGPWSTAGDDQVVRVTCRDATGILQASEFTLLDLNTVGILPSDTPFAYTYANRPTKAAYRGPSGASSAFRVARTGIVRTGTGRYTITLPKVPSGGVAHVSAVGRGTAWCQLRSLRRTGSPMQAQVACYGPGGTPKDSRFTFAWAK